MENMVEKSKNAFYKVVKTVEIMDDQTIKMYGVEGSLGDEVVTLKALSCDEARVTKLVDTMNECGLELCQLRDVINDFLYYYNKENGKAEE